jgi:hypothetical protein
MLLLSKRQTMWPKSCDEHVCIHGFFCTVYIDRSIVKRWNMWPSLRSQYNCIFYINHVPSQCMMYPHSGVQELYLLWGRRENSTTTPAHLNIVLFCPDPAKPTRIECDHNLMRVSQSWKWQTIKVVPLFASLMLNAHEGTIVYNLDSQCTWRLPLFATLMPNAHPSWR